MKKTKYTTEGAKTLNPYPRKIVDDPDLKVIDITPSIRVRFISFWAFKKSDIKEAQRFVVTLHKPLNIETILERMQKGFGDL